MRRVRALGVRAARRAAAALSVVAVARLCGSARALMRVRAAVRAPMSKHDSGFTASTCGAALHTAANVLVDDVRAMPDAEVAQVIHGKALCLYASRVTTG